MSARGGEKERFQQSLSDVFKLHHSISKSLKYNPHFTVKLDKKKKSGGVGIIKNSPRGENHTSRQSLTVQSPKFVFGLDPKGFKMFVWGTSYKKTPKMSNHSRAVVTIAEQRHCRT